MGPNDLAVALGNSQVQETAAGGISFLKMDFETGEWLLGRDQDIVTGDEILVNTSTIQHGWILWSGGRASKLMTAFNRPIPTPMASQGDAHPKEGRTFQGAMMDDGEPLAFETNSFGGRKGVDVLLGAIKLHAATGSKFLYPKVKLASESYLEKKHKNAMVFNPVFQIVAWCDEDANEEQAVAAQVTDQSEAAPKTRRNRRTKAEMVAEEAAERANLNEDESNPLPDDAEAANEPPPADEPVPPRRQRRQRSSAA
tara:strand:- start:121 stop:885 length:765 start_codon:yes stop_codon:yes gene_type:complete